MNDGELNNENSPTSNGVCVFRSSFLFSLLNASVVSVERADRAHRHRNQSNFSDHK